PNFLLAASQRGIPLLLINGRLSERSFRGYRMILPLIRGLLRPFSVIAVQADEYRQRFLKLGAEESRTVVTGSIKFDGVRTDRNAPRAMQLREWLQIAPEEPVFIAGSTQHPEEEMALAVYRELLG